VTDHRTVDPEFWRGRRVLLTGHTGFKGSWAALWLASMGAEVAGLALPPNSSPSLFKLIRLSELIQSHLIDLRDRSAVAKLVAQVQPEIVLHLAAQALVRESVRDPVGTIATNVLGTAHLLDALRGQPSLSAVLVVTSDKVYANANTERAFVESDRLGGKDPYSASKAATEAVAYSFARTFFDPMGVPVATARGGNVVGGGDFSADRLIPDLVRAIESGTQLVLRHPDSTRPWQHVLDCLAGYLTYAQALVRNPDVPRALNFGPQSGTSVTVGELATALCAALDAPLGWRQEPDVNSIEMHYLAIDPSLAAQSLGFRSGLSMNDTIRLTTDWYRGYLRNDDLRALTLSQIQAHASGS
jgi:CDP-glucose 4,6-dehydratase